MTIKVSVVVPLERDREDIGRTVRSLDHQTLPYHDFEVLLVDLGISEDTRTRLRRLEQRRPHVRLVGRSTSGEPSTARDVVNLADGELIVAAKDGDRFLPEALELMARTATEEEAGMILGRATPGRTLGAVRALARAPGLSDAGDAVVGYRTALLRDHWPAIVGFAELADGRVPLDDAEVCRVWHYLCVHRTADPQGEALIQEGAVDHLDVTWSPDGFGLIATLGHDAVTGTGVERPSAGGLLLEDLDSGRELLLPLAISDRQDAASPTTCAVDVRLGESPAGHRLPQGRWSAALVLGSADRGSAIALHGAGGRSALVAGQLVGLVDRKDRFVVHVGGPGTALRRLAGSETRVEESVRGTKLTVKLRQLTGAEPGSVQGQVLLDRLRLPGAVHVRPDGAVLECLVSGLAGRYTIATQFGTRHPEPTGLDLVVSENGEMTTAPTRKHPPKPPPGAGRPGPVDGDWRREALRQLGRYVPERLRPAARRLSARLLRPTR